MIIDVNPYATVMATEALEGGFDRKGNYKGTYLFDGYKGDLPWHSR